MKLVYTILRACLLLFFAVFAGTGIHAQAVTKFDSLRKITVGEKDDTFKVKAMIFRSGLMPYFSPDSALIYADSIINLSSRLSYPYGMASGMVLKGSYYEQKGNLPLSLDFGRKALAYYVEERDSFSLVFSYSNLGLLYNELGDRANALHHLRMALHLRNNAPDSIPDRLRGFISKKEMTYRVYKNLAEIYLDAGLLDSALYFVNEAMVNFQEDNHGIRWSAPPVVLGYIYMAKKDYPKAVESFSIPTQWNFTNDIADNYIGRAKAFWQLGEKDSTIKYGLGALQLSRNLGYSKGIMQAADQLSKAYERNDPGESIKYFRLSIAERDSIYGRDKLNQLNAMQREEETRKQEAEAAEKSAANRLRTQALLGGIFILIVASGLLWRNNRQKLKARRKVEAAYADLQSSQRKLTTTNRELAIENALEKVRAVALGMTKQDDLKKVAYELRIQMGLLGQKELETCVIHLYDESPGKIISWSSLRAPGSGKDILEQYAEFSKKGLQILEEALAEYEARKGDYILIQEGEKAKQWISYLELHYPDTLKRLRESAEAARINEIKGWWSCADFPGGSLIMVTTEPPQPESRTLLKRFAGVFGFAYQRFRELRSAEMQTRESQIQLALERVRSRTMAMQRSEELSDVAYILFRQFRELGEELLQITIGIVNEENRTIEFRITGGDGSGSKVEQAFIGSIDEPCLIGKMYEGWKAKIKSSVIDLSGPALEGWIRYRSSLGNNRASADVTENRRVISLAYFSYGVISISTPQPLPDETLQLLERFARVFDQTYTRFLDLKNAEAQAREAQVESALERVRSKTMAMGNSDDVGETVATLFAEFSQLGIHTNRCGILIFGNEDNAEVWTARSNADGKATLIIGMLDLKVHQLLRSIYKAWKDGRDSLRYDLKGSDLVSYYEAINRTDLYPVKFDLDSLPAGEFHFDFFFPEGTVFAFAPNPIEDEHARIMRRFAGVFGQTYRRYLDLQKAEAGAKEAIKQAALDRIRAEIASMRTKQDLDRITPLIWKELKILNIPFLRCGIFIMDDAAHSIHTFLSAPDGRAIASFTLAYDKTASIAEVVRHWQQNRTYAEHWSLAEFNSLADSLWQQGEIGTREQYLHALPAEGLYLHFVPFMQGMLYAGNTAKLSAEEISLLQAVADAFSTAYARYEDFNRVEKTLIDLRQAQSQLIQAEKMASLGELTAGIAHEIQNPLNFVNNFSEVNTELAAEISEAAAQGDLEEVRHLAADIRSNQERISEHGKRADAIVKSMLQHSRTGTGQKEMTEINQLADEFVRLAYHGMRAREKDFNLTLETDFDPLAGRISIVPQDIGRVLLNLFNNAFYAVAEKKKTAGEDYQPTVYAGTKKLDGAVEISVRDNGGGIPPEVKDKIFQPFFTTKPTGQGTGLGLSLSYDIITKGHGGELRVETKMGEGSEFIISLPIKA